jgi:conjugative relaxase-like TrwC/TraI family protein
MMSMSGIGGGSDAAGYYQKDNYYTRDQASEASGWSGKGAEELGLKGAVDEKVFADVLDGKLPNGDVIKSPSGEHRAGWDITLSAPKSISLMALVGGDKRIEIAMRDSVKATLVWIEKNLIESRIWDKEAKQQVPAKTGNLVAASFVHDVNRNNEPQLHVHNAIANASLAPDGKWHAIRNEALYDNQHLIGSIHSADLRARIEALGYETQASRHAIDGNFEIVGVTRKTIEAYSSRSDEINEHTAANGFNSAQARELAALATRNPKEPNLSKEQVIAQWQATAKAVGFDAGPLIAASLERASANQTVWSRATEGLRTVGAVGMAFAARMGLTPKDGDPLVPERLGRLDPVSFATAQAVASAVRELGEREAAFSRFDVMRAALQHYGPFTVEHVEARIDLLVDKKLLIAGEALITTPNAIAQEQRVIDAARQGNGAASPIATGTDLASRLQVAANEAGLRRLNQGQVNAGIDVLSSVNRVHLIQGGAGVGKSAALAPVAAIARAEGHNVIALSHVGRMAREFGEKVGEDGMTVDRFLGRYNPVLTGKARAERIAEARSQLGIAVIMIDEASQIGTARFGRLVDLANAVGAARLIFAGDTRQLPAIEAGKPFDRLQDGGQATSLVTENMRAKSDQMVALNQALEAGDTGKAFAILEPDTVVVERGAMAATAARMWGELGKEARDQTLLLTSSRALRTAANEAAQAELRALGEIGGKGVSVAVLDRVTITREGARQLRGYQDGRIVEFASNLSRQGFAKGERGTVVEVKDGKVELQMSGGELRAFDPSRLPRNLSHDAVTLFEPKQITLHQGDRIRWTTSDNARDFRKGDFGHVLEVSPDGFTLEGRDGQLHQIDASDKMSDRLDLAYAINVHVAQGVSEKLGIALMSGQEKLLNTGQAFLTAMTRFIDHVQLVVDDPTRIARDVSGNPGGKTSAIEETQGVAATTQPASPSVHNGQLPAPEPNQSDFGHGKSQPAIEPTIEPGVEPTIEPSRDFDMDM